MFRPFVMRRSTKRTISCVIGTDGEATSRSGRPISIPEAQSIRASTCSRPSGPSPPSAPARLQGGGEPAAVEAERIERLGGDSPRRAGVFGSKMTASASVKNRSRSASCR